MPAEVGNKSCCAQPRAARIAGLRTAPLPAQSSPASQHSGDGGLPSKKIALDLQLPDLPVQIVDHLLRIRDRRCLAAARKQLARTLHQLLLPVADHRRMNPKFYRQLRQGLLPESAAIATRALNSALCCFLFTPTSHAPLDRSAFSLSRCPKIRSRRRVLFGFVRNQGDGWTQALDYLTRYLDDALVSTGARPSHLPDPD